MFIYYSFPAPKTLKAPIIHKIGFHNKKKPIIVNIENTDQNQKSKSWLNTGNILFNNIKTPNGTAANANTTLTTYLIRKTIISNNT